MNESESPPPFGSRVASLPDLPPPGPPQGDRDASHGQGLGGGDGAGKRLDEAR